MFKRTLRVVLAISLAVTLAISPAFTATAFAWASYEGIAAFMAATPLHEDMTQFAYARLIKERYPSVADSGAPDVFAAAVRDSGDPDVFATAVRDSGEASFFITSTMDSGTVKPSELLRVSNETEYASNVYFLRMGAYWNDVPVDNAAEFAQYYAIRNSIPAYAGASYGSAYNVGRHLAESTRQDYARSMLRFSFNERANFLHSMLGIDANGTYLDQKTVAEFQMQWLEVAYKYARDGKNANLTPDQKALLSFIDPYGQLVETGENAGPGSQSAASDKMSEKQMRLRALGSMCHTLEDSFNPAHSIRSYYSGDGSTSFGNILAYGNYITQGSLYHKPWDAISPADTILRENLQNGTRDLAALKAYNGNFDAQMQTTHTLGLYLAWDSAYTLMDMYSKDATWEDVKAWLESKVLVTNFNDDGSAKIWDAGRRIGNIAELTNTTEYIGGVMNRKLSGVAEQAKRIEQTGNQLYAYHRNVLEFYHQQKDNIMQPVYHSPYEESGQAAAQGMLQAFRDGLEKASNTELEKMFKAFPASIMPRWKTAMQSLNGIAQEFSLDLNGKEDFTAKENTTVIMNILNRITNTQITGLIAAKDDSAYLLRTLGPDNVDSIIRIEYGPQASSLQVGQMANITFTARTPDFTGQPVSYTATRATRIAGPDRLTAKGILTAYSDTGMVLTSIDGTADFQLKLSSSGIIPDGLMGREVTVVYTALPNQPLTAVSVYGLEHPAQQRLPQATVVALYGGEMRVRPDEATDEDDAYYNVSYGDADIIGTPSVGAKVNVTYSDFSSDADASPLGGFIMSTRIACDDHTHSYLYQPNGDSTHQMYCTSLDMSTLEDCTRDADGRCTKCDARSSYIILTSDGKTNQFPWNVENLQNALATAQDGDVLRLVPIDGVSTMSLGNTMLTVSKNLTLRLGGVVLRYTGEDSALTSSASSLKLENGTIVSENTALTHTGSSANTLLTGVTLYAQKGYTVTGGGSVELGTPLNSTQHANLTGGGVDMQSAQPVSVKLNSALQKQQVQLALAQTPTMPMTVLTFMRAGPIANDLANIAYGTKNAYDGDDIYVIAGKQIQLIQKITPTDPKKALINGAAADNSTFRAGTVLTVTAYKNDDFTPVQWILGYSGEFPYAGISGDYTSDRIFTGGFAAGEQTLTVVYKNSVGSLAAEVYTVNFTKTGGGGGGGEGGGGSKNGSSTTPLSKPVLNAAAARDNTEAINEAVKNAIAKGITNPTAYLGFTNYTALTKDGINAINAEVAAANGKNVQLNIKVQLDNKVGNTVASRMIIDPAKLAAVMPDNIGLGIWFNQAQDARVIEVRDKFTNSFDNNLFVVSFEQNTPLAVNVELALKLDVSKLNAKSLCFYSYNPVKNIYTRILAPNYWVDKNGYSHMTAPFGGSIIITDKPLILKK